MRQLFFDLDGTLTDPKLGITRCIQYALEGLGEPHQSTEALTWCIGPPLKESFDRLVGPERSSAAVELYRERFAETGLFENEPYAGIHDTLAYLAGQGATLYVASSKPLVFVERILERYELAPFFNGVFGSELDGTRADKSELLEYALAITGVDVTISTMIGDREHDAIGARRNNLEFVGVLYGYGDREELKTAGAQRLATTHEELQTLLI